MKNPRKAAAGAASANEAVASAKPFQLVVHVGAGKTGTSSIQQTLRQGRETLRQSGLCYLGLNLEFAPLKPHPWQKPRAEATRLLIELGEDAANNQVYNVLSRSIKRLQAEGVTKAIWSNEMFFRRSSFVIDALRRLADDGIDIRIVAYVRRHDAWARSSYVQWGLKDKTNRGALQNFAEFCARRPAEFAADLAKWRHVFGNKVMIRNMDAAGDTAADFFTLAGIDTAGLAIERHNETPELEELILRASFNGQVERKAPPAHFNAALDWTSLPGTQSLQDWITSLMPAAADLEAVVKASADDRAQLNAWLAESGQPPIDTTPLPERSISVDNERITAALTHVVMRQAARIQALEEQFAAGKFISAPEATRSDMPDTPSPAQAASAAGDMSPVFAISTGRSGSTLVQRVLNCHKDLVVWGEHYGMLNGLAQSYVQMASPDQKLFPLKPADNTGPGLLLPTLSDPAAPLEWANPWSTEEMKDHLRQFIGGYFGGRLKPGQRWGFKEIRYNVMPTLRMLHELYPKGRFVFIRRDAEEVTRSKVSAFVKESRWSAMSHNEQSERVKKFVIEVRDHYHVYDSFMKRFPKAGMAVDFEDLVDKPRDVIAGMLNHLNLDPDRFDWSLADQVLGSVITKTKRDPGVVQLIREVVAAMPPDGTKGH